MVITREQVAQTINDRLLTVPPGHPLSEHALAAADAVIELLQEQANTNARRECARIAIAEFEYWAGTEDNTRESIMVSTGAMGAAANIAAALLTGKTEDQVRAETKTRTK